MYCPDYGSRIEPLWRRYNSSLVEPQGTPYFGFSYETFVVPPGSLMTYYLHGSLMEPFE